LETYRAVIGRELGEPEVYHLETLAMPIPAPGQVRIAVSHAGVSFVDVLISRGRYQVKPSPPFTPGMEFSGIIEAVGEGVSADRLGQRVAGSALGGGFAEKALVEANAAIPIPAAMSLEQAAVFRVNFLTAYHGLVQRAATRAGETVLVLGAGGGVGLASIQMAKVLGARVIGSASTAAKRELARVSGADVLIDASAPDWRDQVRAATDGKGVDVVVDPVGGAATEPAFRSLAWNGRHLVIGFTAGDIPRLGTNLALLKGGSLVGVDIRQFGEKEPAAAAEALTKLFEMAADGRLKTPVGARFALEDFRDALRAGGDRAQAGRVVIEVARP